MEKQITGQLWNVLFCTPYVIQALCGNGIRARPNLFEIPFLQDLAGSGLEKQGGWYVSPMEAGDAGKDDSDSLPAF